MNKDFLIIVEGSADITFFKSLLLYKDNSLTVIPQIKPNKKELCLESPDKRIKIQAINGYTQIIHKKTDFENKIDKKYKILIIQDADDPSKNDGGVENRLKYLNNIKNIFQVDFDIFLFPNNIDNGDLETLLLKITNANYYQPIYNSYHNFYSEEIKIGGLHYHELMYDKNIVFNYLRTYYGMEGAKEENRVYESIYWDLNNVYLEPLITFLKKHNVLD